VQINNDVSRICHYYWSFYVKEFNTICDDVQYIIMFITMMGGMSGGHLSWGLLSGGECPDTELLSDRVGRYTTDFTYFK